MYFADENAKKLPYHRWYRKAAATSEYLSFAGFNQSSIVTRRDTIREPVNLAYETFTLRSLLPVAQYESLPSEHYRNYVCTHFTFVPWPIDRTTVPRRAVPLDLVEWLDRAGTSLTTPFDLEVKWHEHALVPRLVPTLSNPSTIWIIFSILREATTSREAVGLKTFYSSHPRWYSALHIWPDSGFFSIWYFSLFFSRHSFPLSATLQYTVFYRATLRVTAMRIIFYNILYCSFIIPLVLLLRCTSRFYLHNGTMDFSFSFRVIWSIVQLAFAWYVLFYFIIYYVL